MQFEVFGSKVELERPKLKRYLQLEELRVAQNTPAVPRNESFSKMVQGYLAGVFSNKLDVSKQFWADTILLYSEVLIFMSPTLPLPMFKANEKEVEPGVCDYPGRSWYTWLHKFSKHYGWEEKYISELDVDTAYALLQEQLIENVEDREWEWGLTEMAYPYNADTKTSKFNPLPRPSWMREPSKEIKKFKIAKTSMPMGVVVGQDGKNKSE